MFKKLMKRYFIDAMGAMAYGLFASLLIGTIFSAIGLIPGFTLFSKIGVFAKNVAGPAMAVSIAIALKAHPLVACSCAAVGWAANDLGKAGGPFAVLLIAIIASEIGMLVSKKTKFDIVVTPFVTVFVGGVLAIYVAPYINVAMLHVQEFLAWAMTRQPYFMGLIMAVVVGLALSMPVSSAAIAAGLLLTGAGVDGNQALALAGGAALAGCCAHMVGFAFMSFPENRWGGLLAQGLGTSKIQLPNIMRNPAIVIPPVVVSMITGPIAVAFGFKMYGAAINSGMGTCGLLGPIGIIIGWFGGSYPGSVTYVDWIALALICFILPAILCVAICVLLRKIKWIKPGDMKLQQ